MNFAAIILFINKLLDAINTLVPLFKKPAETKVEDSKKSISDEKKEFEETGRPPQ